MSRRSLLFFLVLPGALAACGGNAAKTPPATPGSWRDVQSTAVAEAAPAQAPDPEGRALAGRAEKDAPPAPPSEPAAASEARDPSLVIYEARFVLAVHLVDAAVASVERLALENGGWVARKQDREIVVRIPRARFRPVVEGVGQVGDVLSRDVSAVDVTDEHVDLEVRIKNARAMQARLHELLSRASVKDALEIEKELHRVTEELERMEGRLKLLSDKIAYSTITVTFAPRARTIEPGGARLPFPWLNGLGLPSLLSLSEGS